MSTSLTTPPTPPPAVFPYVSCENTYEEVDYNKKNYLTGDYYEYYENDMGSERRCKFVVIINNRFYLVNGTSIAVGDITTFTYSVDRNRGQDPTCTIANDAFRVEIIIDKEYVSINVKEWSGSNEAISQESIDALKIGCIIPSDSTIFYSMLIVGLLILI